MSWPNLVAVTAHVRWRMGPMARILVVDDGSPILAWLRDPLTDGMHFGITARNGQHRRQGRNAEKREGRSVVLCQNGV